MKLSNLIEQQKKGFVKHNVQKRAEKQIERIMNLLNQWVIQGDITINCSKLPKGFKARVKYIKGRVNIKNATTLQFFQNLQKVGENFYCDHNKLTTLKGAPEHVDGYFSCSYNELTTLEGAPKYVGGSFYCSYNKLTTLEGAPKHVNGHFSCPDNQLTTLKGAPKHVGGSFSCPHNQLTTLKGAPESVGGIFWCSDNQLTTLEGAPKHVGKGFYCHDNRVKFTKEDVKKVSDVKGKILTR